MKRSIVFFLHTSYWALFILLLLTFFFFAVFVPAHSHLNVPAVNSLVSWGHLMLGFALVPCMITFYTCYTYLFDHFLRKHHFAKYLMASIITALIASCIGAALASLPFLFGPAFLFGDGYASALLILLIMTVISWINGMFGVIIKASLSWYLEIRVKEELHRKNIETELKLVKSQIDPHFLFNTLNNIDILITRDAPAASAYLNKLSGIMRFLLYETKAERISLERELFYVQQYIDLQKIRTSNPIYVSFEIAGEISDHTIAPMVLLPFIENAFKHTESRKTESRIQIELLSNTDYLVFTCTNTLFAEQKISDKGLGNALIRKRLELLYPNAHILTIKNNVPIYTIKLELSL